MYSWIHEVPGGLCDDPNSSSQPKNQGHFPFSPPKNGWNFQNFRSSSRRVPHFLGSLHRISDLFSWGGGGGGVNGKHPPLMPKRKLALALIGNNYWWAPPTCSNLTPSPLPKKNSQNPPKKFPLSNFLRVLL